jgi:hypothetical protein
MIEKKHVSAVMIRPTMGNVKNRRPFVLDIGSLFNASFELSESVTNINNTQNSETQMPPLRS